MNEASLLISHVSVLALPQLPGDDQELTLKTQAELNIQLSRSLTNFKRQLNIFS